MLLNGLTTYWILLGRLYRLPVLLWLLVVSSYLVTCLVNLFNYSYTFSFTCSLTVILLSLSLSLSILSTCLSILYLSTYLHFSCAVSSYLRMDSCSSSNYSIFYYYVFSLLSYFSTSFRYLSWFSSCRVVRLVFVLLSN